MDISSVCFFSVMGLALLALIASIVGMFWEVISHWRDVRAWRAWQKRHPRSFIQYPDKPVYWCKYNKNRKTAK